MKFKIPNNENLKNELNNLENSFKKIRYICSCEPEDLSSEDIEKIENSFYTIKESSNKFLKSISYYENFEDFLNEDKNITKMCNKIKIDENIFFQIKNFSKEINDFDFERRIKELKNE